MELQTQPKPLQDQGGLGVLGVAAVAAVAAVAEEVLEKCLLLRVEIRLQLLAFLGGPHLPCLALRRED